MNMNVPCLMSLVLLLAGCATEQKYAEFEPKGARAPSDPAAYASYGPAMAHCDGYQTAYEWQRSSPKLVSAATKPDGLAPFAEPPEAADELLAKIGTAYDGDPVALTQIAAVTQLVMCPKCPDASARRKVWTAAIRRAKAASDDGYVRTFCNQQLRLCE